MNQVHLFVAIAAELGSHQDLLHLLDAAELKRYERFKDVSARNMFVFGRAMMKSLLAKHLNQEPKAIKFSYAEFGKPLLSQDPTTHFNLSHSGELLVFALSSIPIGIDIEFHKPIEFLEVANTVFNKKEYASIAKTDTHRRTTLFYDFWTRKEAFIKCLGFGLSLPISLKQIDILTEHVKLDEPIGTGGEWDDTYRIYSFKPEGGYSGAFVIKSTSCDFQIQSWKT